MKTILLQHSNAVALVDDADYEYLSRFKWYDNFGYATRNNSGSTKIRMHREIIKITDPKIKVDHRDMNRLNNQRENLRVCTQMENKRNGKVYRNNPTGLKGVYWEVAAGKWRARIRVNKSLKHLGLFTNIKDAAQAYDKAARKYFGEFARLNYT